MWDHDEIEAREGGGEVMKKLVSVKELVKR